MSPDWERAPFGEVIHVYQPTTIAVKDLDPEGIFPVYGANGIIGTHSELNHENSELILGCRGSVGSLHKTLPNAWINGNAMVVRPDTARLITEFVHYALVGGIDISAAISGTAQPQITRKSLANIQVPIPPLEEQQRIVAKLDEALTILDELDANLATQAAELSMLWSGVLDDEFYRLGTDYPIKMLGELTDRITDGSHNPPKGVEFSEFLMLSSKNIEDDHVSFSSPRYLSQTDFDIENKRTQLVRGDILLTIVGTIGRCAVFEHDLNIALQRSVAVIRPKASALSSRFGMYALQALNASLNEQAQGTAQKGIYLGQLREVRVPTPPIDFQNIIVKKLDSIATMIQEQRRVLSRKQAESNHFRAALLKAAFNGEL